MAKTKIEIKFDLKTEAAKGLYAGAGVADLAVAAVRDYVATLTPAALRERAVTAVNTRVEAVAEDAKARRSAVEARVAELQGEAKALPTKATETYTDLAQHGQSVVKRIRKQADTKDAVADAKTTVAKARTARTQAKKTVDTAKTTTRKAAASTRKTVADKAAPAKSSAKGAVTAAKKTTTAAAKATETAVDKAGTDAR